jgi:hypothetical protein
MHPALKLGEKKKVITTEAARTKLNLGAQDFFFSWMLTTATSLGTGEATPLKVMAADADHSRVRDTKRKTPSCCSCAGDPGGHQ